MLCRLCCKECLEFQKLYDEDDHKNNIYKICQKYFFQEMEKLDKILIKCSKIICNTCWKTISEFNDFCENIVTQQTQYCKLIAASMSEVAESFIMKDLEGVESDLNNELLRKSPLGSSKSCDLKDDDQKTDSFTLETTIQKNSLSSGSVTSNRDLIDSVENETEGNNEGKSQVQEQEVLSKDQNKLNVSNVDPSLDDKADQIIKEIDGGRWKPIIRCDLCEYSSLSCIKFISHYKENHPNNLNSQNFQNPFECEICCSRYKSKKPLQAHYYTHRKFIECPQCGKEFRSKKYLETHIRWKHPTYCSSVTSNSGLIDSVEIEADENNACKSQLREQKELSKDQNELNVWNVDPSLVDKAKRIIKEIKAGQWKPILRCDLCEYACLSRTRYKIHYKKSHPNNLNSHKLPNPFECEICYGRYESKTTLREHFYTHRNFIGCPHCEKKFHWKSHLKTHITWKHPTHSGISFLCEICYNSYDTNEKLQKHLKSHFKCPLCGKNFRKKTQLEAHIKKNGKWCRRARLQKAVNSKRGGLLLKTKSTDKYGAHLSTELCLQQYRQDLDCYESSDNHEKNVDAKSSNETFIQTKIGNIFDGVESDFIVHNEVLRESAMDSSKRYGLENVSHNTDTFMTARNVPNYLVKDSSEMSGLNDSFVIKVEEEFINDDRGSGLSEDGDASQSLSNSFLAERVAEGTAEESQDQEIRSNLFVLNEFQKKRIKEIKNDILNEKWTAILYCDLCEYSCEAQTLFVKHYKNTHPNNLDSPKLSKPFECEICHRSFPQKNNLKCHYQTHIKFQRQFKCPECDKRFTSRQYLRAHIRRKHLDNHKRIKEIHSEILNGKWKPILHCDLCEYSCEAPTMFVQHYKNTHPDNPESSKLHKPFECEICHRCFTIKKTLEDHYFSHFGIDRSDKKFKCTQCEMRFSCRAYLKSHIKRKHIEKCKNWVSSLHGHDATPKQSLILNKESESCKKQRLKLDSQIRDVWKMPQTELNVRNLDPVLVDKANKVINDIIVEKWAPIMQCDFCEYSADSSTMFIHYKLTHLDDLISLEFLKTFECDICLESFYSKISLTRHMHIHENPGSRCSHCGQGFDCKESLDIHMQDKHFKSGWGCDLCGVELTTEYNLADHKAKKVCITAKNSSKSRNKENNKSDCLEISKGSSLDFSESCSTNEAPIEIRPVEPSEKYGVPISTEQCLQQHIEDLDCYESQETQGRDEDDKCTYEETLFEGLESDFILDD